MKKNKDVYYLKIFGKTKKELAIKVIKLAQVLSNETTTTSSGKAYEIKIASFNQNTKDRNKDKGKREEFGFKDILATPFLVIGVFLLTICANVGGAWTAKELLKFVNPKPTL